MNLAYTQGYNPQPKLNLAAPLPIFHESVAELGEIDLLDQIDAHEFMHRINAKLPPEVQVTDAFLVAANTGSSLTAQLFSGVYHAASENLDS